MVLLSAGCRSNEPLKLDTIQVGRALSPDNRIGQITSLFRPDDTIYVSVLTTDTGSGTIGVKWMYGDRLISEPSKEVSYKGAAATEFHIQNSGGSLMGSTASKRSSMACRWAEGPLQWRGPNN